MGQAAYDASWFNYVVAIYETAYSVYIAKAGSGLVVQQLAPCSGVQGMYKLHAAAFALSPQY